MNYNIIAALSESTVVSEYIPEPRKSDAYQSEAALENEFIRLLQGQGYEYIQVRSEAELVQNLRRQLEALNRMTFTEEEWKRFFKNNLAGANEGIVGRFRATMCSRYSGMTGRVRMFICWTRRTFTTTACKC